MRKTFDDAPANNQKPDPFFDGVERLRNASQPEVYNKEYKDTKKYTFLDTRDTRVQMCVKVYPWVNKFVDDLVYALKNKGNKTSKGNLTEVAFRLLYEKAKEEGIDIKIDE
jgi:hypothetical protein